MEGYDDQIDQLDADERHDDPAQAVDEKITLQIFAAPKGRNFTPLNASGISRMMMIALKMTALRMALCGEARRITFSGAISGNVPKALPG